LPICPNDYFVDGFSAMAWRCFKKNTIGVAIERRPKKRIKEMLKETTTFMFLDSL
jgi:hypothetical protein